MKRSAKFNEKAMKKKLLTQTQCGAPVSNAFMSFSPETKMTFSVMFNKKHELIRQILSSH